MPRLTAVAIAAALAACSRSPAPAPAGEKVPAGAADPASPAAPIAVPVGPAAAYVSAGTILRREPTDAARVPGGGRKQVANQLALLQRGEKVTVLEAGEEWARVRASDDREGWLRRAALLEGDGLFEATVLVPADVFDRPDLLAANAKRKIEAGTLLLVVKARAPFSEVNVSSGPNAWVLTDRLSTAAQDVSVAKLAEKARWLLRSGKPEEAAAILALAREHFAGSALLDAVAAELEAAAAPEGAVVPASAAAPER